MERYAALRSTLSCQRRNHHWTGTPPPIHRPRTTAPQDGSTGSTLRSAFPCSVRPMIVLSRVHDTFARREENPAKRSSRCHNRRLPGGFPVGSSWGAAEGVNGIISNETSSRFEMELVKSFECSDIAQKDLLGFFAERSVMLIHLILAHAL
jgi:hypothetical protein